MNKLLLSAFVALTFLMVHVRWSSGNVDTFYEDFVSYPSLKAKRDLEFEEFLTDGDMKMAKRRARDRQRRMNEENMSETLKRHRRSLLEEDEEGEDESIARCRSAEYSRKRSDDCMACIVFSEPISWKFSTESDKVCGTETKTRFKDLMVHLTDNSDCKFEGAETTGEPDITIECADNAGNFAPIGNSSLYKQLNVEQIYSGKAGKKVIYHELGHLCCLDHTQKLPGASKVEKVDTDCVVPSAQSQYEEYPCAGACAEGTEYPLAMVNPLSGMQYPISGFLPDGCSSNIEARCESLNEKVFNIRKSLWFPEIKLIREAYCIGCPGTLEDYQVWGNDCKVLELVAGVEADEEIVASESSMCLPSETYTVESNQAKVIKCPAGKSVVMSKVQWSGIPDSTGCKSNYMRGLVWHPDTVGEYIFVCGSGEEAGVNCIHYLPVDAVLVLDGKASSAGNLSVDVACC